MDFATALRNAMGDESQAALSDRTGIRQATISRYLAGQRQPQFLQLQSLEEALPKLRKIRQAKRAA